MTRTSLFVAAAGVGVATMAAAMDPLVATGDRVGPGLQIESFSGLSLGPGGRVAALAAVAGPKGDKGKAIIVAGPDGVTLIAHKGQSIDPASADGGIVLGEPAEPWLSPTGQLAFTARARSADGQEAGGLFVYADGRIRRIVRDGATLSTREGGMITLTGLRSPRLAGDELHFIARPQNEGPGLYRLKERRVETLVAAGSRVPNVADATFAGVESFDVGGGKVVFMAPIAGGFFHGGGNLGLFAWSGGRAELVVRQGSPWRQGPPTRSITGFVGAAGVASDGSVVFAAQVRDAGSARTGGSAFIVEDGVPRVAAGEARVADGGLSQYVDDGRTVPKGRTGRPDVSGGRNELPTTRPGKVAEGDLSDVRAAAAAAGRVAVVASVSDAGKSATGVFVLEQGRVREVVRQADKLGDAVVTGVGQELAVDDSGLVCFVVELDDNRVVIATAAPKPPRRTGRIITDHPAEEPGFGRQDEPRSRREIKSSWDDDGAHRAPRENRGSQQGR